ncbi:putative pre-rRna-processing protein [Cardiosporidium cionae]|uniref:Pre-rRna-processing protein n=1 Tax=Cardiosporidium cionae TaxID=476202 RepID=A0ABQ7JEP0_9APIC|nr:putative pre-rRna-processing protein [Cardiosporidium cionae]|eukprot:KAF8822438.1 putative pre-rRna-processing protein [Cardiosporidium cionae]
MAADLKPFVEKHDTRGVIYITSIPPYMSISKLRHYMEQFGDIGRIYLTPEDPVTYRNRRRAKGCKKTKYVDGWIEFSDRKLAKNVAEALNGQSIGGKKRHNFWRDDIWNIRYLPKFKWHNLTEHSVYKNTVRQERLRTQLSQVQRENQFYAEQMNKHKRRKQKLTNGSSSVDNTNGNHISNEGTQSADAKNFMTCINKNSPLYYRRTLVAGKNNQTISAQQAAINSPHKIGAIPSNQTQRSFHDFTISMGSSSPTTSEKNARSRHFLPNRSNVGDRRESLFDKTTEASDILLNALVI